MKQSEFKKRYDVKMGRYVKKHIYGEGPFQTLSLGYALRIFLKFRKFQHDIFL